MSASAPDGARRVPNRLEVVPASPAFVGAAERLARDLDAVLAPPLAADGPSAVPGPWPADVVLWVGAGGIGLLGPPQGSHPRLPPPPPPRARPGRDLLLRALGAPAESLHVVDATAGWAEDAGILAAAGARVTMVERSAAVAAMLDDALARWRAAGIAAAERMRLLRGDATAVLAGLQGVDVVVLDPFFPGREGARTTAAELAWLRRLVARTDARSDGGGPEAAAPHAPETAAPDARADRAVLDAARAVASRRVVVKRPRSAPPLAGVRPSGSIGGRVVRFDLYPPTGRSGEPT